MNIQVTSLLITFLTLVEAACNNNGNKKITVDSWYETIKGQIQENSSQKEDSVSYHFDREILSKTYWLKGRKLREEYRSPDTSKIYALTAYGKNELFELRNEMHSNGHKATEGIVFNNDFYGPWSVWYPNGQLNCKGLRYKNHHFGKWEFFLENGKVKEIINNNRSDLADSILARIDLKTSVRQN